MDYDNSTAPTPSSLSQSYDHPNYFERAGFSDLTVGNSRVTQHGSTNGQRSRQENTHSRSVSLSFIHCGPRTGRTVSLSLSTEKELKKSENDNGSSSSEVCSLADEDSLLVKRYFGFTKVQFRCGIALVLLSIIDMMGFGIFAPFFPVVAQKKNLSELQIGFIFAAYPMAGIFGSVFTGSLLVKVGAKFIILAGMFWSAGGTICLGLLDKSPEEYFFWLSCACRVLMGIGSSSAFTAMFAVIFREFGDRALTAIGISESLCTIGGIVGPLLGGGLYSVGGYYLPFAVLGGMSMIVLFVCAALIPHSQVERQVNAVNPAWLLLNLHALFSSLFVIVAFIVISFISADGALFLTHSFGLSAFMIGVFMLVFTLTYGLSTPVFGWIADSKNIGAHVMTVCCFSGGVAMSLLGPADVWMNCFGWEQRQQWLSFVSIGIVGMMLGGIIMPTFGEMITAAKHMKLQENELAQYGLVSGLWNLSYAVGDIAGPTVGGAVSSKCGFSNTAAIIGAIMLGLALLKTAHLLYLGHQTRENTDDDSSSAFDGDDGERQKLLATDQPSVQA